MNPGRMKMSVWGWGLERVRGIMVQEELQTRRRADTEPQGKKGQEVI